MPSPFIYLYYLFPVMYFLFAISFQGSSLHDHVIALSTKFPVLF